MLNQTFARQIVMKSFTEEKKAKVLESLKKELIKRLMENEKNENKELKKALIEAEKNYTYIAKSGNNYVVEKSFPVGTHRTWKGQEYVKIAPGKWRPFYKEGTRGAKLAASAIAKKIQNAKDIDELMQIVSQNMQRFGFSADGENDKLFQKLRDAQKAWGKKDKESNADKGKNIFSKIKEYSEKNNVSILRAYEIHAKDILTDDEKKFAEKCFENANSMQEFSELIDDEYGYGKRKEEEFRERTGVPKLISNLFEAYILNVYDLDDKIEAFETKKKDSKNEKEASKKELENRKKETEEAEKHQNRSDAMKGNQNAYKGGVKEEEKEEKTANSELEEKLNQWSNHISEKIDNYKNDWYTKATAETGMNKLGEKKLKAYAELNLKNDEEYKEMLMKKIKEAEEKGEPYSEYTVDSAIWDHYYKVEAKKIAQKKLDNMNKNKEDEDIPVDPTDLDEAISIIGSDVTRILEGRDYYGNAKQGLVDKIKRRIRNQPGIARAMLKHIQNEQKRTGKVIFTPKHSIWQNLPALNENARNSMAKGETETKTGISGNLYEGEDGTTVVEDKDWGRYRISFNGKPSAEVISTLKHNGFRWSQKNKEWVGYNTANGERSLARVAEAIGLKKVDTKAPEAKTETSDNIEKELNKKVTLDDIKKNYTTAKSVTGNSKTYRLANGEKVKCHYKIVEADTPTASHDENTYQKTEGFPSDKSGSTINDRDYEHDKDAQESVRKIAANYSGLAIQDPPIVTKDGIVVSGNNRTMSSKLAAKQGTDKDYLKDLAEEVEDYGIDAEELKNFKHPRLILEIDEPHKGEYTTEEFAKYNQDGKKSMNTTEKAVKISKTIKPETVTSVAATLNDYETMAEMWADKKAASKVINTLVNGGVIGRNDVSQYYTEESGISEAGKEFVETVLIGSVMNETNIRSLAGDGGKSIRQKLVRGIVPLIDNKGMGNEYSFNNELNEAVRIATVVMKDREHFTTVKDYLDQENMFEEKADPITSKLAEMIYGNSQKEFASQMKSINAGLRPAANGEMNMFLGRCETRNEVMEQFLKISNAVKKAVGNFFRSIFA